ncbi:GTPase family protein [Nostoc sp. UHCC 0252]|uniref:GTPase family protein n=1 Tax=Nostoc sp. UHCC 0252 TaxID=3110241 RepID=UPI002B201BE9|nr:GTPase [Nostoc sp. UHCC 0252]MEA5603977.1 GTPase [Nostoc sp. UHCC 0252]
MSNQVNVIKLAIFGQTGSGKTSLSNILFGLNWQTDNAVSCTQEVHQHEGKLALFSNRTSNLTWQLLDTPGVGESEVADEEHFQSVYSAFHSTDVILWVVQADTRAFAEDQKAILKLTDDLQKLPNAHFVLALNQIDRIYPEDWDEDKNVPSHEQFSLIPEKINLVYERFHPYIPVCRQDILPCSVLKNYGLQNLVNILSNYQQQES